MIGNNVLEPRDVGKRRSLIALRAASGDSRHFRCADGAPRIEPDFLDFLQCRRRYHAGEQAVQADGVFQAQEAGQVVCAPDAPAAAAARALKNLCKRE